VLSPTQSTPISSHKQPTPTSDFCFSWGGDRIYAAVSQGRTRVLSYPSFVPALQKPYQVSEGEDSEYILKGHTSDCNAVKLSPTGRWLATGGDDSVIALWDTQNWICKRTITCLSGPVESISKLL